MSCRPACPDKPPSFEVTVRQIQAETLSFEEKARRIHEARLKLNATYVKGADPSKNGLSSCADTSHAPCPHYERRCKVKCSTCAKYYPCRICHDNAEGHQLDRFATEVVQCTTCGAKDQPATEPQCRQCSTRYARYHCKICRLFDDSEKDIFHCHQCGLCRIGKGHGIDIYHCDKCEACVPLQSKDTHPCVEGALKGSCPICFENLFTSRSQVIYTKCGHAAHQSCFSNYTKTKYTCPICCKSLTNMDSWFRTLDTQISLEEPLPEPFRSRRCNIFCHDCEKRSTSPFHFTYTKCATPNCGSYNTRVLSYSSKGLSE